MLSLLVSYMTLARSPSWPAAFELHADWQHKLRTPLPGHSPAGLQHAAGWFSRGDTEKPDTKKAAPEAPPKTPPSARRRRRRPSKN